MHQKMVKSDFISGLISSGHIRPLSDMAGYENFSRFWPGPGMDMISGATLIATKHNYQFLHPTSQPSVLRRRHHKQCSPRGDCSLESAQVVALQSATSKHSCITLTAAVTIVYRSFWTPVTVSSGIDQSIFWHSITKIMQTWTLWTLTHPCTLLKSSLEITERWCTAFVLINFIFQ